MRERSSSWILTLRYCQAVTRIRGPVSIVTGMKACYGRIRDGGGTVDRSIGQLYGTGPVGISLETDAGG